MHSIGDAAELLFGRKARQIIGFLYYIYLASPALRSAGPLIKKASCGIALLGLIITAVVYCHIAAK